MNIDLLLPILGDKLEREALSRYKHNEEWAIRGVLQDSFRESEETAPWERIKDKFRQEITNELTPQQLEQFPTEEILEGLPSVMEDYIIAMVRLYQKEAFDPLTSFSKRLVVQGRRGRGQSGGREKKR